MIKLSRLLMNIIEGLLGIDDLTLRTHLRKALNSNTCLVGYDLDCFHKGDTSIVFNKLEYIA